MRLPALRGVEPSCEMMVAQTKGVPAAQRAAASEKMELMLSSLYALAFPGTPLLFSCEYHKISAGKYQVGFSRRVLLIIHKNPA
jgi:hypothetical protein